VRDHRTNVKKESRVHRYWPALRLSAGLVSLCVIVFLVGCALGLAPDRDAAVLARRKALCESLAVHCSLAAQKDDLESAEAGLQAALERNPDILSAGLRAETGKLLVDLNHHDRVGEPLETGQETETAMQVAILQGESLWATLELRFTPVEGTGLIGWQSMAGFVLFFSVSCGGIFFLFLRSMFVGMGTGPGRGPPQAQGALSSLDEGILILDGSELTPNERRKSDRVAPKLDPDSSTSLGDSGMVTVDNLTNLERKHAQLRKVLDRLRGSRRVVRRQNHELKALARRDPLTGCLNRRSLFTEFEKLWEASKQFKKPLSCLMVDIDHFKSINDSYGHQKGDEVLRQVAETLRATARKADVVCRYGGEEFCILLPQIDLAEAERAAERLRRAIADKQMGEARVTASFGVSSWCLGAKHPQEMLEQADKALYAAKRSGRNKVARYDRSATNRLDGVPEVRTPLPADPTLTMKSSPQFAIPFQAVSGLLAALGYRHAETAEHCRRVADLCVSAAGGLMSQKEAYIVEMAALLHDIGKLGVPDNVLLKAGPLTNEEWKTIRTHEGIGVEIIRAAFTSDDLAEIVRLQHCWYAGSPTDPSLPQGQKIPLAARLLMVANAFDSMTSEHSYRKALSQDEAIAELRRCAGTQFDPSVTEHFIEVLGQRVKDKQDKSVVLRAVSKQTALKIGVQIEKLSLAADVNDLASLVSMASQLRTMAQESGIAMIADAALKLEQSAAANSNQMDLIELTIDLLEMCRRTQRALLPIPRGEKAKRSRPKTAEAIDLRAAESQPASPS
jgi:diguanylate cyclase (GGDEF)-like protein